MTISVTRLVLIYLVIISYCLFNFGVDLWVFPITAAENLQYQNILMTPFWLDEYQNGPAFIAKSYVSILLSLVID